MDDTVVVLIAVVVAVAVVSCGIDETKVEVDQAEVGGEAVPLRDASEIVCEEAEVLVLGLGLVGEEEVVFDHTLQDVDVDIMAGLTKTVLSGVNVDVGAANDVVAFSEQVSTSVVEAEADVDVEEVLYGKGKGVTCLVTLVVFVYVSDRVSCFVIVLWTCVVIVIGGVDVTAQEVLYQTGDTVGEDDVVVFIHILALRVVLLIIVERE